MASLLQIKMPMQPAADAGSSTESVDALEGLAASTKSVSVHRTKALGYTVQQDGSWPHYYSGVVALLSGTYI